MGSSEARPLVPVPVKERKKAREILAYNVANELIFAIVGYVGSGTSEIARNLKEILEGTNPPYDTEIIKASDRIREWASAEGKAAPNTVATLSDVGKLQDLGDEMRQQDPSAIARALIKQIRLTRARKQGKSCQ